MNLQTQTPSISSNLFFAFPGVLKEAIAGLLSDLFWNKVHHYSLHGVIGENIGVQGHEIRI